MSQLTKEDRELIAGARMLGLKTILKLTPAQAKNWPAVEAALIEAAKTRHARSQEVWKARSHQKKQGLDLAQRLHDRVKGLRTRAEQIEKFANAAAPLLGSLDPAQTRRFGLALRSMKRKRIAVRQRKKVSRRLSAKAA